MSFKTLIQLSFISVMSAILLTACIKTPVEESEPTVKTKVEVVEETTTITQPNDFLSIDGQLAFSFAADWTCKEVIYNQRVDCYPNSRQTEEFDIGFDQYTVPYPEITIYIRDCVIANMPDFSANHFERDFGGCKVVVATRMEEGEVDAVLFSE